MTEPIDWDNCGDCGDRESCPDNNVFCAGKEIKAKLRSKRPEMAKLMRDCVDYVHDQIVSALPVTEGVAVIDLKPLVDELMVLLGAGE